MIQYLGIEIHNLGLSNAKFIIDGILYEYTADKYRVEVCSKIARKSDKRALNYIKKHAVDTIKTVDLQQDKGLT